MDLDDDAVIELEEAEKAKADLGENPRGGRILNPTAADQLIDAATFEGLISCCDRCLCRYAFAPPRRLDEVAELEPSILLVWSSIVLSSRISPIFKLAGK